MKLQNGKKWKKSFHRRQDPSSTSFVATVRPSDPSTKLNNLPTLSHIRHSWRHSNRSKQTNTLEARQWQATPPFADTTVTKRTRLSLSLPSNAPNVQSTPQRIPIKPSPDNKILGKEKGVGSGDPSSKYTFNKQTKSRKKAGGANASIRFSDEKHERAEEEQAQSYRWQVSNFNK